MACMHTYVCVFVFACVFVGYCFIEPWTLHNITCTGIVGNTKALLCEHSDNVNQVTTLSRIILHVGHLMFVWLLYGDQLCMVHVYLVGNHGQLIKCCDVRM